MEWLQTALKTIFHGVIKAVGNIITTLTTSFVAFKGFILTILFVVIPVMIYNFVMSLVMELMEFMFSFVGDELSNESVIVQISGFAGWVTEVTMLPTAVSIYLSFLIIRFCLSLIPFI